MTSPRAALLTAWIAHGLAWAASLYLALAPTYRTHSVEAVPPGAPLAEPVVSTATLVEVNGPDVLLLLALPIALTGVAVAAMRLRRGPRVVPRIALWASVAALLLFCLAGAFSIGLFYLPAAIALAMAAAAHRPSTEVSA